MDSNSASQGSGTPKRISFGSGEASTGTPVERAPGAPGSIPRKSQNQESVGSDNAAAVSSPGRTSQGRKSGGGGRESQDSKNAQDELWKDQIRQAIEESHKIARLQATAATQTPKFAKISLAPPRITQSYYHRLKEDEFYSVRRPPKATKSEPSAAAPLKQDESKKSRSKVSIMTGPQEAPVTPAKSDISVDDGGNALSYFDPKYVKPEYMPLLMNSRNVVVGPPTEILRQYFGYGPNDDIPEAFLIDDSPKAFILPKRFWRDYDEVLQEAEPVKSATLLHDTSSAILKREREGLPPFDLETIKDMQNEDERAGALIKRQPKHADVEYMGRQPFKKFGMVGSNLNDASPGMLEHWEMKPLKVDAGGQLTREAGDRRFKISEVTDTPVKVDTKEKPMPDDRRPWYHEVWADEMDPRYLDRNPEFSGKFGPPMAPQGPGRASGDQSRRRRRPSTDYSDESDGSGYSCRCGDYSDSSISGGDSADESSPVTTDVETKRRKQKKQTTTRKKPTEKVSGQDKRKSTEQGGGIKSKDASTARKSKDAEAEGKSADDIRRKSKDDVVESRKSKDFADGRKSKDVGDGRKSKDAGEGRKSRDPADGQKSKDSEDVGTEAKEPKKRAASQPVGEFDELLEKKEIGTEPEQVPAWAPDAWKSPEGFRAWFFKQNLGQKGSVSAPDVQQAYDVRDKDWFRAYYMLKRAQKERNLDEIKEVLGDSEEVKAFLRELEEEWLKLERDGMDPMKRLPRNIPAAREYPEHTQPAHFNYYKSYPLYPTISNERYFEWFKDVDRLENPRIKRKRMRPAGLSKSANNINWDDPKEAAKWYAHGYRRPDTRPKPERPDYDTKDYVYDNARTIMIMPPRKPIPKYIDDRKGTTHLLEPSGLIKRYIYRWDFGKVPGYLMCRNHELGRPIVPDMDKFYRPHRCKYLHGHIHCKLCMRAHPTKHKKIDWQCDMMPCDYDNAMDYRESQTFYREMDKLNFERFGYRVKTKPDYQQYFDMNRILRKVVQSKPPEFQGREQNFFEYFHDNSRSNDCFSHSVNRPPVYV